MVISTYRKFGGGIEVSDNFGGGDGPRGWRDPDPSTFAKADEDEFNRKLGEKVMKYYERLKLRKQKKDEP